MRIQVITGLLREITSRIIENKWLKIFSLILAILLFRFSNQPNSIVKIGGVPVEFQGIPAGMEIVNIDTPVVSVQVRGPQNMVTGLTNNQISVTANLSNKEQGERIAHLQTHNVNHPERIEVLNISPTTIRLRLEKTVSRAVKVIPMTEGTLPAGLEIYETNINPETILVEGPQRDIEKVTNFLTETINLDRLSGSFNEQVDVEVPTPMRIKGREQVRLSIVIGEKRQKRILNIPVILRGEPAEGRRLTPRRVAVELFGPESIIRQIQSTDVLAEVSLVGLPRGETLIAPVLTINDRFRQHITVAAVTPTSLRIY
jgi:YbbR domain-containing protein